MESIPNILDWDLIVRNAWHIALALFLALPLGVHRERAERLGLRTIPLVSVAACGFILIGHSLIGDHPDAFSRLLSGLITGVGFLGGGAILKHGTTVYGTATAASIWNTAAIGAAVACDRFEIGLLLSLINVGILVTLGRVQDQIDGGNEKEKEFEEENET